MAEDWWERAMKALHGDDWDRGHAESQARLSAYARGWEARNEAFGQEAEPPPETVDDLRARVARIERAIRQGQNLRRGMELVKPPPRPSEKRETRPFAVEN